MPHLEPHVEYILMPLLDMDPRGAFFGQTNMLEAVCIAVDKPELKVFTRARAFFKTSLAIRHNFQAKLRSGVCSQVCQNQNNFPSEAQSLRSEVRQFLEKSVLQLGASIFCKVLINAVVLRLGWGEPLNWKKRTAFSIRVMCSHFRIKYYGWRMAKNPQASSHPQSFMAAYELLKKNEHLNPKTSPKKPEVKTTAKYVCPLLNFREESEENKEEEPTQEHVLNLLTLMEEENDPSPQLILTDFDCATKMAYRFSGMRPYLACF